MIDYLLQGLNAQEYEYSMTSRVSRFGQQHLQKHLFIKERYLRTVRKYEKIVPSTYTSTWANAKSSGFLKNSSRQIDGAMGDEK